MLRKAPQTNVCFLFVCFLKKGTSYLKLFIFKNIWYLQISSAGIIKSAFITSADTFFFLWKNPLSLELCGDFPARASCFNILMRFISGSFFLLLSHSSVDLSACLGSLACYKVYLEFNFSFDTHGLKFSSDAS